MHHVVVIVVVIVVHVHLVRVAVGRRARRDLTRQSVQRLKHFHRSPPPGGRISVPPSLGLVHPWGTQDYSSFPVSIEPQTLTRISRTDRYALSRSLTLASSITLYLSFSITRATARPVNIYIYFPPFLARSLSLSHSRIYWTQKVYTVCIYARRTDENRHTNLSLGKFCSTLLLHTLATVNAKLSVNPSYRPTTVLRFATQTENENRKMLLFGRVSRCQGERTMFYDGVRASFAMFSSYVCMCARLMAYNSSVTRIMTTKFSAIKLFSSSSSSI